jgi:hypothetical protein
MRAVKRRRPRREERLKAAPEIDLTQLSRNISYQPSPEHKDYLTTAGPGKLRSDASACPRALISTVSKNGCARPSLPAT